MIAGGVHKQIELYYWAKNRAERSAEVDFCIQYGSRLVGIEVKSGNILKMISLFSMGSSDKGIILVRISWDSLKVETYRFSGQKYELLSIPFYLVDRLPELIDQFIG